MKELILVLVIACSLGIGGCTKDNNTVNDNNTKSPAKVEEKIEEEIEPDVNEDKQQQTQTSKIIGVCYECGKDLYDNEFAYDFGDGNHFLCKACYNTCSMCEATMNDNEGQIVKGYGKICDNCYKHIDICDNCGMTINLEYEESYKVSYGTYCENCYIDLNASNTSDVPADTSISYYCDWCENPVYTYDEQHNYYDSYLCSDCYTMAQNIDEDLGED